MNKEGMTSNEVAAMVGVSARWVRLKAQQGVIDSHRGYANNLRYHYRVVDQLLALKAKGRGQGSCAFQPG
mgnify:FL=1